MPFREGEVSAFKGRHHVESSKKAIGLSASLRSHTNEAKLKISKAQRGVKEKHPVWNAGLTKEMDSRLANQRHPNQSISMRKIWSDPLYKERVISKTMSTCGVKPNQAEKTLEKALNSAYPGQWRFVGDGSFWIKGKNPDFINVNGKKKIIELLGCYWHGCKECFPDRLVKSDPMLRRQIFESFGYSTLFIWEHELAHIDKVLKRIKRFD